MARSCTIIIPRTHNVISTSLYSTHNNYVSFQGIIIIIIGVLPYTNIES